MKKRTAALYDPYLDIMGGGEKHILSILQVLEKQGYDVSIFWNENVSDEIYSKLNLSFTKLTFLPNISTSSFIKKMQQLVKFDIFLYVTDGSYFFSSAKKNFVFCMVPNNKLYNMGLLNQLKTYGYRFISNSTYTEKWLQKWDIETQVIYPYINQAFIETDLSCIKKKKNILSVGRFFPHLHSKKHDVMLKFFEMFQKKHPDYSLIIAGGLKKEDYPYFQMLQNKAQKMKNVIIKANVSFKELLMLYRTSSIFWHFTGYGIDENQNPDLAEHFGMTPLEAMAAGTVPFCYNAGGPKEIIIDGKNGYLFTTGSELLNKMELILSDQKQYKLMQQNGQRMTKEEFSFETFEKRVVNVLLP